MEKNGDRRVKSAFGRYLPLVAVCAALVGSSVLTVLAFRERERIESRSELARLALEDVARRVEQSVRNLESVRAMNDAVALSRARAFSQLIASDPSLLDVASRGRFNAIAADLNVDELHVTDSTGMLVRSFPDGYEGRDMASSAQSAAFMPAITNSAFELVQEPQGKGLSLGDDRYDTVFQYAGVARRDSPGIVQIGYRAERVAEAARLADVDQIVATTRVGRDGRIRIRKLAPGESPASRAAMRERDLNGAECMVFETDCAGYRVSVVMPESFALIGADWAPSVLLAVDLLLILLALAAVPRLRRAVAGEYSSLRDDLSTHAVAPSGFRRMFLSPLSLAAFAVFAVALALIAWYTSRQAYRDACESLRAAAADMIEELDNCIDAQLAFIGQELCFEYGTPEAMRDLDLAKMMKTYFVDEINIVNEKGVCIASTVDDIRGQDQRSLVNPGKFCKALIDDGEGVFSQPFRESATEPGIYRKYVGVAFPPPARGYIQIGFERIRLRDSLDNRIKAIARNWHIGERGFFVVSKTTNGAIVSSVAGEFDGKTIAEIGFDVFSARTRQNVDDRDETSRAFRGFRQLGIFSSRINGEECLCTSGVVNQFHRYVAAIPLSEVYASPRRAVAIAAAAMFAAMVLVVFFLTRMSDLVASLKRFIEKDKEQREQDLAISRTIQTSTLPVVFPDTPTWRIFARMMTAREVGGDFFDFYELPSGKVFVAIADVSGKGVPAAMFMMRAKTAVRACVFGLSDLGAAISSANDHLSENNEANMFVTAWMGVFDPATGDVEYVNAGHNPPLVKRADGSVEWLRKRSGPVLAAMEGVRFRVESLRLAPGDSLFLYTDGVTEAFNSAGELYGEQRLEAALRASDEKFVDFILADLERCVAGAERADAITALALDFKRAGEGAARAGRA
ncbi:MAG: serine/threonine-protein phosphatase [Kiritimatiellae bacterium]|nr:serine/threonine-protein phosphatase [Kiritimatiellia bacterium]